MISFKSSYLIYFSVDPLFVSIFILYCRVIAILTSHNFLNFYFDYCCLWFITPRNNTYIVVSQVWKWIGASADSLVYITTSLRMHGGFASTFSVAVRGDCFVSTSTRHRSDRTNWNAYTRRSSICDSRMLDTFINQMI